MSCFYSLLFRHLLGIYLALTNVKLIKKPEFSTLDLMMFCLFSLWCGTAPISATLFLQLDSHTRLKNHFYVNGFKTNLANLLCIICMHLLAVSISTHHIGPCRSTWIILNQAVAWIRYNCATVWLYFLMVMVNNRGEKFNSKNPDLRLWASPAAAGIGCGCRCRSEQIVNFHQSSATRRETVCHVHSGIQPWTNKKYSSSSRMDKNSTLVWQEVSWCDF